MPTRLLYSLLVSAFVGLGGPFLGGFASAQDDPKEPDKPKKDEPEKDDPRGGMLKKFAEKAKAKEKSKKKGDIKPYDDVITDEATTSVGLFWTHRLDDKVFFEIPEEELGVEMLWVTQIEQTQTGYGYGGSPVGDRVVRWERREDDILLRDVNYAIRAEVEDPIQDAVKATSLEAIIAIFPIQAFGKDQRPVIDVTSLYTSDLPEFSASRAINASGVDSRRTFIEKIKAFPTNIEAKVLVTYRPGGGGGGPGGDGGGARSSGVTVLLHHSMVRLPEEPMQPRRYDDRVGYFNVSFEDYGSVRHEVEEVRYITRWRLEKKDPKADVSDPKQPIVFYLGREIPEKWRPYVKKGIEAWQPAFEKAGFSNAILAKEPPDPREDPDWDAEDARYSSIRWLPATIENAMGPHVHDPRSGEILESDILVYHNILKLTRDWYFVQASPNDERAQKLPISDELLGELLTYVISHEVGHTLGFRHNMKASSSYTVEQLRDPEFTKKYGVEASIMDYGRFNYVAQPGDGAALIPIIGPYDNFAVEWGYKEFPDADDYDEEKAELDKIAARQLEDPKLLFGDPDPSNDPSQQTEDLGSDAVLATELGLKNIDRVAEYLVEATSKEGENYDLLQNMYSQLFSQRNRELGHVVNLIGGFVRKNLYYPEGKKVYTAVSAEQQKKAVAFLIEHQFKTPESILKPDILDRLEAYGAVNRVLGSQTSTLRSLLNPSRLNRLSELGVRSGADEETYQPSDLMDDLHGGIWSELEKSPIDIDLYRRNLQRTYVDLLASQLDDPSADSDVPALARGELEKTLKEVKGIVDGNKETTPVARLHLEDIRTRIEHALDAIPNPSSGGGGIAIEFPFRRGTDDEAPDPFEVP